MRRAFDRAADTYAAAALLQHEVSARLDEALDVVSVRIDDILDMGCGTGEGFTRLRARYPSADVVAMDLSENMLSHVRKLGHLFYRPQCVCADMHDLPFADDSFDLVFSSLALQWSNDPAVVFREVNRVLRPGGLFVFSTFGPDTLKELRSAWSQVDDDVHVNDFTDMHDLGDELLRSVFAEPVMHAEHIVMQYDRMRQLARDLKDIGANVTGSGHRNGLMTPSLLKKLEAAYDAHRDDDGILPATYEVVYGHAWKPASRLDTSPGEVEVRLTK